MLCFVVVMQSFIMNSHEVFIHIHQGCFAGTGAIVRLPQCQWSKPDGYGKISQCITTTKQSKNRVHISWDILYVSVNWVSIASLTDPFRIYIYMILLLTSARSSIASRGSWYQMCFDQIDKPQGPSTFTPDESVSCKTPVAVALGHPSDTDI